jgi:phenylacetate-CoA ligase
MQLNDIYSNILKNTILPLADKAMQTNISYYFKKINKMRVWSKPEIINWQEKRLVNLITHAFENTDYYRNLFNKLGIAPNDIQTIEEVRKIPPLTKEIIMNNFNDLMPKNISKIHHKKTSTGGSTGDPLVYLLDNQSWSFSVANNILNWERTDYRYGEKYIALGSTSLLVNEKSSIKHRLYYRFKNKIGLNGMNMSDQVCKNYSEFIKRNGVKYLYGYASSIYLLAKYIIKANEKLDINACFPTSEILTDNFRETIKKAFNCVILNGYGAHDGGITAFEHEKGIFEVGYNCIINFNKIDSEGRTKVLLTDLLNFAMPLINYEIGDELVKRDSGSSNSFNGQVFSSVLGRSSDVIELENGNVITGPGFTVLFGKIPVDYYNIKKIGLNSILCTIKKRKEYSSEHESVVISTLRKHCGSNSKIEIVYTVENIYTESGKVKYFG